MRTLPSEITSAINEAIKKNSVVTGVQPSVILEWNMNNCFSGIGVNLYNSGDDIYSFGNDDRLYYIDSNGKLKYPKTLEGINERSTILESANSVASPWREPTNLAVPVMTNNVSDSYSAPKIYDEYDTNLMPITDEGYMLWNSQPSKNSSNFFKSEAETLSVSEPNIQAGFNSNNVEIIGAVTQTAGASGTIRLLIKKSASGSYSRINISSPITVSQWNNSGKSITLQGTYSISGSGNANLPDYIWGNTRGGDNLIKFASYRWNTFTASGALVSGSGIKPSSGSSPVNWWGSSDGYGRVTGVSKNYNNARFPNFWTDITFSPQVGNGISFLSRQGVIYTYFEYIDIAVSNVPDIVVTDVNNANPLKQLTSVETTRAQLIASVSTEEKLNEAVSRAAIDGGSVVLSSNISLTHPVVIPSNVSINLNGYTISESASFDTGYDYLFYTNNPKKSVATCSSVGDSTIVTISTSDYGSWLTAGRDVIISQTGTLTESESSIVFAEQFSVSAKIVSFAIDGSSINITLNKTITKSLSGATISVDKANDRRSSNIIVSNGSVTLYSSNNTGFINADSVNGLVVKGVTVSNGGGNPIIKLSGCSESLIYNNTLNSSSTGLVLESGSIRNSYDSCYRIQIESNTFNCLSGVETIVNSGSEISNHNVIKIINNDFTGAGKLVSANNVNDLFVSANTFDGSGSNYGIIVGSNYAKSRHFKITGNTFDAVSQEIAVVGFTNGSGITGGVISNNNGIDHDSVIVNSSFIAWLSNTNGSGVPVSNPTGTFGSTDAIIEAACPTTIYKNNSVEVIQAKKSGKKITVRLAENLTGVKPGDYVVIDDVHPQIDGARRVLGYAYQNEQYELVVDSVSSGVMEEFSLNGDNEVGRVTLPKYLPINNVVVKFDISYGTPSSGFVQALTKSGWVTLAVFDDTDLSSIQERDIQLDCNIKTLKLYSSGGTFSTTVSLPGLDDVIYAGAVRVIIQTTTEDNTIASVAEVSGRMLLDISSDVIAFNIDKELGSGTDYMPVGISSSNTGDIDLMNENLKYSPSNAASPLNSLLVKNVLCHIYLDYASTRIKAGTMIVESWDNSLREEASISLADKSLIFQDAQPKNIFLYQKNINVPSVTVNNSVRALLNCFGFNNIKLFGKDHLVKAFYCKEEGTAWSVIQEMLEPFQSSAYFDEYGTLQIMHRDYIYPEVYYCDVKISVNNASDYIVELITGNDANIERGMFVVDSFDSTNYAEITKIDGNVITLGSAMTEGRYNVKITSGRINQDYEVNRNSSIPITMSANNISMLSSNNFYSFDIVENYNPSEISGDVNSTDYCRKITKLNEFYVDGYKRTGSTVTANLKWATATSKAPANGDRMFLEGAGSGIDANNVSVTLLEATYITSTNKYTQARVTYSLSGSQEIPYNNDSAGIAGYSNSEFYYRASNLYSGQEYRFTGYVTRSGSFTCSITTDASVTESETITTTNEWQPVDLVFVADDTEHIIKFTFTNMNNDDSVFLINESLVMTSPEPINNSVDKDEVIDISISTLDTASSVEVNFKTLNPYSEKSSNVDGVQEIGKNAELWKMEDYILPVFDILEMPQNGQFKFDNKAMNGETVLEGDTSTVTAWIPYSGKFTVDGDATNTVYEYEGLEVEIFAPKEEGLSEEVTKYVIKNNEDFIDAKNLNLGRPVRFTGIGFLVKDYPDPQLAYDEIQLRPSVPIVTPGQSNYDPIYKKPVKRTNVLEVRSNDSIARAVYVPPAFDNINVVGCVVSAQAAGQSEVGVIYNGDQSVGSGIFVGVKSLNGVLVPMLSIKNSGSQADQQVSPLYVNNISSSPFYQVRSMGYGTAQLPPVPIKIKTYYDSQRGSFTLYVGEDIFAEFSVSDKNVLNNSGRNGTGIFATNCNAEFLAMYNASIPSANVITSQTARLPDAAQIFSVVKKDNPGKPDYVINELVKQYIEKLAIEGSALAEINEYDRLGLPNQYISFYGVNSGIQITPINTNFRGVR